MQKENPELNTLQQLLEKAQKNGRLTEALTHAEAIRKLLPKDPRTLATCGNILAEAGAIDTALSYFARARERFPQDARNLSDFLYMLHFVPTPEALLFLEHKRYAELFETQGALSMKKYPPKTSGKIRIGYLSPDMYRQASHYILESVARNHDKRNFELFFYCTGHVHDAFTKEIRKHADQWREHNFDDTEGLLTQIRTDEIDILVDLAGHTGQNSLPVFARRAAPIQVSWFGYMDTSGLRNMDYRITDAWRTPLGREKHYTEKLIRLPNSYTFAPSKEAPPPVTPPHLSNGFSTFGSFNSSQKNNPQVLATWAEILKRVPTSKLLVVTPQSSEYTEHLLLTFGKLGITPDRIITKERSTLSDFYDYLQEVDISLDPFPYTGGITTYHALLQGVPTITLEGVTEYERNASAIMHEAGISKETVTHSIEEYIEKAVELSKKSELLSHWKNMLPQELRARDGAMVPALENAYQEMMRTL